MYQVNMLYILLSVLHHLMYLLDITNMLMIVVDLDIDLIDNQYIHLYQDLDYIDQVDKLYMRLDLLLIDSYLVYIRYMYFDQLGFEMIQ
jgi:hypothetical protein